MSVQGGAVREGIEAVFAGERLFKRVNVADVVPKGGGLGEGFVADCAGMHLPDSGVGGLVPVVGGV